MRDYGLVHGTFWTSATTHGLSDDGKLLALYLLTGPHSSALGCYRLPDGYVMEDLEWVDERVKKAFVELSHKGFANRCETTKWVLISAYLKFNPPQNPNQVSNLRRLASQIPQNSSIVEALITALNQACARFDPKGNKGKTINSSPTLFQPFLNQEQDQEQDQEHINQNHHAFGAALKNWFAVKRKLETEIPKKEWRLWVNPAYLLSLMSGNVALIALPPNGRVIEAAKARKEFLATVVKKFGFSGVAFTRYPDEHEMKKMKENYPGIYKQFSPAVQKKYGG